MAAWMRTATVIVALGIAAIIGSFGASWLGSPRGGLGPTILQANTPELAAISILIVTTLATMLGVLTAKVTTAASGMFVVGFTFFVLAMRLHGASEFIFALGSVETLMVEAIGLSLVLLASSLVIFRLAGPLKDVPVHQDGSWDPVLSPKSVAIALLISITILPVVWLFAVSPSKGQAIGSAAVGGVIVACFTRKCMPHLQPVLIFAAPTAMAAIGYAIANIFGVGVSDIAFTQNTISPLIFPMPIEYAAGSIMGVAIGLSWGASLATPVIDST